MDKNMRNNMQTAVINLSGVGRSLGMLRKESVIYHADYEMS